MPDSTPSPLNRRQFLGDSARNAATAAAGVVGLSGVAAGNSSQREPRPKYTPTFQETVRVGLIGVRNQGLALGKAFQQADGCRVTAICDVDPEVRSRAMSKLKQPESIHELEDYRALLEADDIDAVVIATPDHHHAWMTALAADAGKHVYLEVPITHTTGEAEQLAGLLDRAGIVVQVGLQQRSGPHFQSAIELLQSGELGDVRLAKAWSYVKRQPLQPVTATSTRKGPMTPSQQQKWLGSAKECPLAARDWHFNWRSLWNFGSGELGDWGVHLLDVARWGMQVSQPKQVIASGGIFHFQDQRETPDTMQVQYTFEDSAIVWEHRQWLNRGPEGRPHGVAFYGEAGTLVVDRSGWKVYDSNTQLTETASKSLEPHVQNFIDAVRLGTPLAADFETGRLSSELCHLGNQAYREFAI